MNKSGSAPEAPPANNLLEAIREFQVSLGMPAAPQPVLSPRRKTRQIRWGPWVSDQTPGQRAVDDHHALRAVMPRCNDPELNAAGCDIVCCVPVQSDADALPIIARSRFHQ